MSKLSPLSRAKIPAREVAIFTRQLATMISANVPLHRALIMYAQGDEDKLGRVVDDVADRVVSGNTLSNSLSYFPRVFSAVYIGLLRAGEQSGQLNTMLEQLADLLERQDGLRKRVVNTLTYPAFLMMAAVLCVLAFMFFILPAIAPLYKSVGVELPLPTRILIGLSNVLSSPYTWTALVVAWIGILTVAWPSIRRLLARRPDLRQAIDLWTLETPVIGTMIRKTIMARILFTLATLVECGIPVASALIMLRDVSVNEWVRASLLVSSQRLEAGSGLAESLDNVLPRGATVMIAVGEESSSLSRSLDYVARVYEEDASMAVDTFAAMAEPLIMAVMGLISAFLVLALFLPMVSLLKQM